MAHKAAEFCIAREPVLEQSQVTTLDMVVGVAMLLAAILSPIPGDEATEKIKNADILLKRRQRTVRDH